MNIDFPLILVILVFGSGVIWALDAVIAAGPRKKRIEALRAEFPQWEDVQTTDAKKFMAAVNVSATEPAIVEYARSFFPVLAAVFVLRSFLFEPFQIPSSSMVPTLEVGDYILVNKYTYGLRLPVLRDKVVSINSPERGDVMVFFPPHQNKTYYIKRVIGVPGDLIEYRDKHLWVNGEQVPREWLDSASGDSKRTRKGLETVGDDAPYLMQIDNLRPPRDFSVRVKPGHYFMMGDNRDNSSDSRVWGQVPERDIVGKAVAIWMHWESFLSVPSFGRVGTIN
ncbi:signal peptidase I [Luminiphilus sp.]|nr:signal peptidase I [Luminiphilus sp.]